MKSVNILNELSNKSMRRWYEWVISRKVLLVESFPVRLSVFVNFPPELDFGSHCPFIRSIEITNDLEYTEYSLDSSGLSVVKQRLYQFCRECSRVEGVRYFDDGYRTEVSDLVFFTLKRALKANALQMISIDNDLSPRVSTYTQYKILRLLTHHHSSLQDLEISSHGLSEDCVDAIMSILSKKRSPLKKLCLSVSHISWQKLLKCLSSVGVHLETLEVGGESMFRREDEMEGQFLSTLGRSCAGLRRLKLSAFNSSDEFSVRKVYQLYELCPNLISINYHCSSEVIGIDSDESKLRYMLFPKVLSLKEEKEMFLECMRLAIQRSQCKLTVSNTDFCYDMIEQYDDWVLFKSKLSPYLTDLDGVMSESILIEAVKGLPRLEKLSVYLKGEMFGDLSLAAIMEYGYSLKTLSIYSDSLQLCCFSDEMISKVIRGCQMLEDLRIHFAGQESVLTVKHHSRLRKVRLEDVRVGKEELSRLLCVDERKGEEKCVWRRLQKGDIYLEDYRFCYRKAEGCWHAAAAGVGGGAK
eukprot:scaffold713_cov185-Ochromonas_danica.AAC.1